MHTLALIAVIVPLAVIASLAIPRLIIWIAEEPETAVVVIVFVLLVAAFIWGLAYLDNERNDPPTAESTK